MSDSSIEIISAQELMRRAADHVLKTAETRVKGNLSAVALDANTSTLVQAVADGGNRFHFTYEVTEPNGGEDSVKSFHSGCYPGSESLELTTLHRVDSDPSRLSAAMFGVGKDIWRANIQSHENINLCRNEDGTLEFRYPRWYMWSVLPRDESLADEDLRKCFARRGESWFAGSLNLAATCYHSTIPIGADREDTRETKIFLAGSEEEAEAIKSAIKEVMENLQRDLTFDGVNVSVKDPSELRAKQTTRSSECVML